ncbi:NADH-quinone oxidoreductase subunit M [Verrucomicrobiales bacterium]|nr:NADH-quinone oxidoreductase subunit M [Verrucomicrobiales bacterium]MDC0312167.1 NADH-quinone oxidoreductase subunit M [bacterium]MDC0259196.1 NADH-quinone oxidoreductase subunit M [Verrucomicrobiales bacterium]MDC0276387.1 NADH-quinone oxidoreductase subunit M [Verrucomicrobiales bacterium]MDC0314644.1 NADH-quinone oxidoreductase subunit M [bacterium]
MPSSLEILVFLPILAALAIGFGAPARFTAIGAAIINLGIGLVAAKSYNVNIEGGAVFQLESSRVLLESPKLALAFGVDGMSLILMLLTVIVTLAAVWASPAESKIKGSPKLYYISSLLIAAGALGAFLSTDLFFLYAFHELALIPTFLMIGMYGHGKNRKRTAWTITIYLGVGSLILLAGLIALFVNIGQNDTFSIAEMIVRAQDSETMIPEATQSWIYLLLLVGFGVLVSLFPFHSWAPDAYADAPTPISMLHAGVLKKFGLYGLIRIAGPMLPAGAEKWMNLVLVLLLGNIIILGLVTIAQKRLDRMIGMSSVMHMGYVFLGVVAGGTIGISGAVLLMFAHGVSIALLFALAGSLRERFGSLEFDKLGGGLGKLVPKLGLLFGFAAFASIGLPGFANFAAEVMIFFGAFQPMEANAPLSFLQWAAIISLWGVVISAVYMLRAFRKIFKGPLTTTETPKDMSWNERVPALLLIVSLMLVGFYPEILLKYLRPALESLTLIGS